jgi:hypothetical protein
VNVFYRITYRNGKIYIDRDRTDSINHIGGALSALMARDFTAEERRTFSIKREILGSSETATRSEVATKELELILQ